MSVITLKEALKKVKYPQDKIVDNNTTDPHTLGFNEGWGALYHQLAKQGEIFPYDIQTNSGESR